MRPKHLVAILVLLMLALPASPAHAGGVVSVCDEAHLLAALAGGGTVTFTCSGTITLTAPITIAADTTIDGSGQDVTISGNHAVRVFTVNSGVTLNLDELTVAQGNADFGGGIFNGGTLTVSNTIFTDNTATGLAGNAWGGGIFTGGTLTVNNSIFSGNSAGSHLKQVTLGTLAIYRTLLVAFSGAKTVLTSTLPDWIQTLPSINVLSFGEFDIRLIFAIALAVVVVFQLVLQFLPYGRRLYAIGSNPDAAKIAGFPSQRIVFLAFVLCGGLSGLAGFMFLGQCHVAGHLVRAVGCAPGLVGADCAAVRAGRGCCCADGGQRAWAGNPADHR